MANVRDLLPRTTALGATLTYKGSPPVWFAAVAKVAAQGCPVVVNTKGIAADATPVVISLADLERLRALAATAGPGDDAKTV